MCPNLPVNLDDGSHHLFDARYPCHEQQISHYAGPNVRGLEIRRRIVLEVV